MAPSISPSPDAGAVDVLVAGAGPAGSAAAALLARAGHRVRLVDRAAFPRDKACSEYMSPEAVRILDRLGVVEGARGRRRRAAPGHRGHRRPRRRLDGRFALAGHRPVPSDRALRLPPGARPPAHPGRARQPGAELLERTAVEELLYDGGAVAGAVVRGPGRTAPRVRARLTIGADGLRSVVARRLGRRRHCRRPAASPSWPTSTAWRSMEQSAELFVGSAGYVGLNPIGGGHDQRRPGGAPAAGPARPAAGRKGSSSRRCARSRPGRATDRARRAWSARCSRPGPSSAWSGRVTADGAALVGDAADFFDPVHRRRDLQRAARRRAAGRHRERRRWSGRASCRRRDARALSPRPAAGLRRQVGGRAADRLRDALSPACSTAPWPGSERPRHWPTP